jgi:hypothetical protein
MLAQFASAEATRRNALAADDERSCRRRPARWLGETSAFVPEEHSGPGLAALSQIGRADVRIGLQLVVWGCRLSTTTSRIFWLPPKARPAHAVQLPCAAPWAGAASVVSLL